MTYPVLDLRSARKVRDWLLSATEAGASIAELQTAAAEDLVGYVRDRQGPDYASASVQAASDAALAAWLADRKANGAAKAQDLYGLEASMASVVHQCLRDLDVAVLADPDFWRFAALGPFRWYLLTREPELQDQDFGGKDGDRKYWLLIRTFLWGQLAYDPADEEAPYRRATAVGEAGMRVMKRPGMVIDFWHSHLIRRYFAVTPAVAHAFIDAATTDPIALDRDKEQEDARAFARRMTRLRRSVDLALLQPDQVTELVKEQKLRTLDLWFPST